MKIQIKVKVNAKSGSKSVTRVVNKEVVVSASDIFSMLNPETLHEVYEQLGILTSDSIGGSIYSITDKD